MRRLFWLAMGVTIGALLIRKMSKAAERLTPRAMASLRDRMPWLVPYLRRWALENRWGVLLIPVTLFGLVVFGVHPWTVAAVLVAVIAAVRWPKVAADLVPVALLGFAAWGFAIASSWQSLSSGNGHQVTYGAVQVSSPQMALLAGVEASVFLAFAAWLVPRTIGAHARTLLHPGPDPELTGRVRQLTETRGHAIDAATSELRRIERDLHDGAQARLVALGMNLRAVERMLPVSPQAALALADDYQSDAVPVLIDLLADLPTEQRKQAEDYLTNLAGEWAVAPDETRRTRT